MATVDDGSSVNLKSADGQFCVLRTKHQTAKSENYVFFQN